MKIFKIICYTILLLLGNKPIAAENKTLSKAAFTNIKVVDQYNKPLKFYDNLIKNKTVAINFIFTTCTSSCPLSTIILRQVQKKLEQQTVQLISISVDPVTDTPERLLTFSNQYKAAPGWAFITGDKLVITNLLKTLDVYSANKNDHSNLVIVGNDTSHHWSRLYGFPRADEIISALQNVSDKNQDK